MSQNIMTDTCSSATNFKKLMPADNMEETMIPDNIKLLDDKPSRVKVLPEDRKITVNRVSAEPAKANTGRTNVLREGKNNIATDAPNAAPAEIPSEKGSARGFSKIP